MTLKQIAIDMDVHKAIESQRRNFEEEHNDILRRLILNTGVEKDRVVTAETLAPVSVGQRTTGNWTVALHGVTYPCRNLKEAYVTALVALAEKDNELLTRLSRNSMQSRRIVATAAAELYFGTPSLADPAKKNFYKHGRWYIDVNLSRQQVSKRIRLSATEAGLHYGQDVKIMINLELI